MQKEGRERQREGARWSSDILCFPEEKEIPDSLPDQQRRAGGFSIKGGIDISDLKQCLWNQTREKTGNAFLSTPYNHKFQSTDLIISTAEKFWVALIYAMVAAWAPSWDSRVLEIAVPKAAAGLAQVCISEPLLSAWLGSCLQI